MLNYIYRFLGLHKLTYRLFFWVLLFLFLSSAVFLAVYISTDRSERISRADAQLQRTLDSQQEIIEAWANDRMDQLNDLSTLAEVINEDQEKIYETFQTYITFSLELEALFYVDQNGDILIDSTSDSVEPNYQLNLKDETYFQFDQKNPSLTEKMYIRLQDETNIILFSSPVSGEDGTFQGIVLGAVSLDKISDLLKNTNLGISGETYIVTEDAELLLEVAHAHMKSKSRTEMHTAVTDAIVEQTEPPQMYQNIRGEEVLGHYSPLFEDLFYVIHEIKAEEILKTHDKMVRTILLLGLGIVFVAVVLIWLVLRDIQNSIASFTEAIGTIQEGNYDFTMDQQLYEKSSSEIKETINVFNTMIETIRSNRQELTRLTEIDVLTDAYNRRTFTKDIENLWADAYENEQFISIAFIDIDNFKEFNDTFGHLVGDQVLIRITDIIHTYLQSTNGTLYRYGGEEFIVLFPQTDEEMAYTYAEDIRKEVERVTFIDDNTFNVTISIGVNSVVPKDENATKAFIKAADDALYQAKKSGRNKIQLYHH